MIDHGNSSAGECMAVADVDYIHMCECEIIDQWTFKTFRKSFNKNYIDIFGRGKTSITS